MILELAQQSVSLAFEVLQKIKQILVHATNSLAGLNRQPEASHPWIFIVMFQNTPEKPTARGSWADAPLTPLFHKTNGAWPAVSMKAGRWRSSKLYNRVCDDAGWTPPIVVVLLA